MKKLLLVLGVLMGLVGFTVSSYALPSSQSSNKTMFQNVLTSGALNGNTAFVTGTVTTAVAQNCQGVTGVNTGGETGGTLLSCPGVPITGISLSGGASGGTVTIYDASTNQNNINFPNEVGTLEVVFEATVAASTQNYYDLHDAPINTVNGVVASATSTSGVVVYTSNSINANH